MKIKDIFFILLNLYLFFTIVTSVSYTIDQTCTSNCGSTYSSIKDAVKVALNKNDWNTPVILLKPGVYKGFKNKEIYIDDSIEIKSTDGVAATTIIDCENTTFGFYLTNSKQVNFEGLTIRNCRGMYGGAMRIEDTNTVVKNIIFESNYGVYGGAIYASQKSLSVIGSTFKNNYAQKSGGALHLLSNTVKFSSASKFLCNTIGSASSKSRNEIYCDRSKISMDSTVQLTNAGFSCSRTCSISPTSGATWQSLCQNPSAMCNDTTTPTPSPTSTLTPTPTPTSTPGPGNGSNPGQSSCSIYASPNPNKIIVDGVCNPIYENCLNNPNDCKSCYFSGIYLKSYIGTSMTNLQLVYNSTTNGNIDNFMDSHTQDNTIVKGVMTSYIKVPHTGYFSVGVYGNNIGIKLTIDSITVVNSYYQQPVINSTDLVYLESGKIHKFHGELLSFETSKVRSLSISFKDSETKKNVYPFFYSQGVCGDGIYDPEEEETCPSDREQSTVLNGNPVDICTQTDPNLDFSNCYSLLTKVCPSRIVPKNHLSPGFFYTGNDMLGSLVSNQFIWHLPGSEHMSYGVDIISGNEGKAPIFYFSYCESTGNTLIEDVYRGRVYDIPRELMGKPLPVCKFSTNTSFTSSTTEMAKEMYDNSRQEYSFSAGGGIPIVQVEAKVAFTQEKSVSKASSLSKSGSSTFITTTLECSTSVVEMDDKYSFHPLFLQELSKVKNVNQMYKIVLKYGTHFYKRAVLGGKLKQVTTAQVDTSSEESKDSWKESSSRSFSASVSTPVFRASASYSSTIDTSVDSSKHQEMESESNRTTVITYGGALGSYGPTKAYETNSFEKWSSSVDLIPIPISYELFPIRDILNDEWLVKGTQTKLKKLWVDAETMYYERNVRTEEFNPDNNVYSLIIDFADSFNLQVLPLLTINYKFKNPITNDIESQQLKYLIPFEWTLNSGAKIQWTNDDTNPQYYSQKMIPLSVQSNRNNYTTRNDFSNIWTGTTYQPLGYKFDFLEQVRPNSPFVFHFTAPDFFNMATEQPTFIIENIQSTQVKELPIQLISWKNSQAVFLNYRGDVIISNSYKLIYYKQRQYNFNPTVSLISKEFGECMGSSSFGNICWYKNSFKDRLNCCIDSKGNGRTTDILGVSYLDKWATKDYVARGEDNEFHQWGSIIGQNTPVRGRTLYDINIKDEILFSSATRLVWAMKFNATTTWKTDVAVYHSVTSTTPIMSQFSTPSQYIYNANMRDDYYGPVVKLVPLATSGLSRAHFNFHNYRTNYTMDLNDFDSFDKNQYGNI
ncbi:hypothetical protein DLAC_11228 [Tieghemostelium lacteum]|uniref:MACPF domain-containing protein n=1 Tax=Tieghemostelium lacteum TaxID=361077 RepID=A0A151Z3H6_TIELA|nr:hypothetical protein DLAC_11228 [Tieghemostelium lacteum]|eukprot:KYQ88510.1 hypothetical protein DLAC_11228 [Tieghemostelium lacteum]